MIILPVILPYYSSLKLDLNNRAYLWVSLSNSSLLNLILWVPTPHTNFGNQYDKLEELSSLMSILFLQLVLQFLFSSEASVLSYNKSKKF